MKPLTFSLAFVLSAGCVSSGDHEALQRAYDKQKSELQATEHKLSEERGARTQVETELAQMTSERDRMQSDLDARQKELSARQAELANLVKDKASLAASVQDMQRAMDELSKRKAEADKRIAEFKQLVDRFKKLIDAGKLRVKIVEGRMVVELATDILFASGSAQLSKDGKLAIEEVAAVLSSIPDRKFQIEGHTDDVPIATAQYPSNWELAAARAVNVTKAMVGAGMPPERVSAASYAQHRPAQANDTPDGKRANRRIEIVIVPDLSSLPGFDELQKASTAS
jgi:chemotaxis protein MotB